MSDAVRWGILGPGAIAHKFAKGLQVIPGAVLAAVGSRSRERANAFGDEYGIPRRYGSYRELAADPDVDAVYVATPHPFHKDHTLLCLEAGKAVLCEKPMAINARQVQEMIDCSRSCGVFLMEAMWTRFLPIWVKVRELLSEGAIGEIRMVTADFGFRTGWNPQGRLFNPELGGGALLDVGVYTIALASMVFGREPESVTGSAHIGNTGVDEQAAMILKYDRGELAVLSCAVRTHTPQEARIIGTEGSIHIPNFWQATTAEVAAAGREPELIKMPFAGTGYNYEALEVMNCLREGKLESEIMPLDESLAIMRTMDRLREQLGLKYPLE